MKVFFLFIFLFLFSFICVSQEKKDKTYSGGMLLFQPGYISTENNYQKINEYSNGLGGILRFYLLKNFTIGLFGGSQKAVYSSVGSDNSYINAGYGGIFFGYGFSLEKIRISLALFCGGSSVRNLHIEEQSGSILTKSYLYTSKAIIYSPIISLDYSITEKLAITIQGIYLRTKNTSYLVSNPAIQFGVLFTR